MTTFYFQAGLERKRPRRQCGKNQARKGQGGKF